MFTDQMLFLTPKRQINNQQSKEKTPTLHQIKNSFGAKKTPEKCHPQFEDII